MDSWSHSLPPDFKRAASEIHRNVRSSGATSVRNWLTTQYTGWRDSQEWQHLWAIACYVDFTLGQAKDDHELYFILGTSDQVEVGLRELSAHVYESRTHDKTGAAQIRAVIAPGAKLDIAPGWLITEATTHSKMEMQREERIQAEVRRRKEKGKGKGKDKGKGKGADGGEGEV